MKVLITCEQSVHNPYMSYHFLGTQEKAESIYAIQPFWTSNLKFDIIHLHWPEYIIDSRIYDKDIFKIYESRLLYWKSLGAKLVITRHNYSPHDSDIYPPELFDPIYKLTYKHVDAIIHHGKPSWEEFEESANYPGKNIIINHPNYLPDIINNTTVEEARDKFSLDIKDTVFVSLGAIRNPEEENLIIEAFLKADIPNKKLIITRSLQYSKVPGRRHIINYISYKRKIDKLEKQGVIIDGAPIIENQDMQYYMNAADAIISPRIGNLNSGIVFLAMSYKIIVIGPDIGNIGYTLKETGNPSYNPQSIESTKNAFEEVTTLKKTDLAMSNYNYVKSECDIYKLGKQYISLYEELTKQ